MAAKAAPALLVLLAGCRPATDGSLFHDACLLDDGRTGLLSYADAAFHHQGGSLMPWGPGVRVFERDVKLLALVEVATGKIEVVHREARPRGGNGGGSYRILATRGRVALVERGAARLADGRDEPASLRLLHIDSRQLDRVDPAGDLAARGLQTDYTPRLVHDDGTLLYEAFAQGAPDRPYRELLLRRAGGALLELGRGQHAFDAGGMLYFGLDGNAGWVEVRVATGERRSLTNRQYSDLSDARFRRERAAKAAVLRVASGGSAVQYAERDAAGAWIERPVPVRAADLR